VRAGETACLSLAGAAALPTPPSPQTAALVGARQCLGLKPQRGRASGNRASGNRTLPAEPVQGCTLFGVPPMPTPYPTPHISNRGTTGRPSLFTSPGKLPTLAPLSDPIPRCPCWNN